MPGFAAIGSVQEKDLKVGGLTRDVGRAPGLRLERHPFDFSRRQRVHFRGN
jgi:hypothetical protein